MGGGDRREVFWGGGRREQEARPGRLPDPDPIPRQPRILLGCSDLVQIQVTPLGFLHLSLR